MRLIPLKNTAAVARWTAGHIIQRINRFAPTARRPFVLGLPTGGTPVATYQELIRRHKAGDVDFSNVVTFNMDEYVGLPEGHAQSYRRFMQEQLFDHINILPGNIHFLDGNAKNLEQECLDYEKNMAESGGVELFLGGVGHDGHIAFNEPGSSLASRSRIKTLTEGTRQAMPVSLITILPGCPGWP